MKIILGGARGSFPVAGAEQARYTLLDMKEGK